MASSRPSDGAIAPLANGTGATARFAAFDTVVELTAYGPVRAMEDALARARQDCRTYEQLLSHTRSDSDLGRLNAAGGRAVAIDPRTADVLRCALGYCGASEGAFDVTVGPLVALWDLKAQTVPKRDALAEACSHVGWKGLHLWAQCGGHWFAQLSDPSATVVLGGIAKGWIADALGAALQRAGAAGACVNLGGNVLVQGAKPDGRPWRVGIRAPRPSTEQPGYLRALELKGGSLVTSGVYERCFERDGTLYHHILDPRTGMPVDTPWAGVSVLAKRSLDAEGFSTTLLALGLERSRTLAAQHPEIEQAYFTRWDGTMELLR